MNSEVSLAPSLTTHLVAGGYASIFLGLFGGLWMVVALNTASWIWLVACVLIPASLLVMRGVGLVLSGHQAGAALANATRPIPERPGGADQREAAGAKPPAETGRACEERAIRHMVGRRLSWVILIDFGAMAVAANILYSMGLAAWTVAAIAAIVAVQFFPWARIFEDKLYLFTGAAELLLCAAIAALMRRNITLADSLFGLVMGLTLWITVVFLLLRGRRAVAMLSEAAEAASR